jgi:nitrogen fixation/metabolism regulation signal transduction histidine kinase
VVAADGAMVALNPAGRQILADFRAGPAAVVEGEEASVAVLLDRFRTLTGHRPHHAGDLLSYDGQRTLRGAVAPLDLPDGRAHTMLVFEDVTEYLENQRLAINAELARQVAHEIKNPLTPIQLSAQLLQQAWRDDHPRLEGIVDESVARILDQVELLRRIAGEFSLLGRPGDLVTEPLELARLVEDTVAAYAGGEIAGAPAVRVAPEAPPPVLGEADSLRKILGNLMQNSLDAVRPGEPVGIEVDWEIAAETVTLRWRDRGTGVPDEVAGRLFDPYFSTKSKGTGLGLAICRNLTDRMGGRISLTNREDGPGAVATLTLRRADVGKDIS